MMTTPFNFMQFNSMIPLMVFYPLNDKVCCAADCPFHRVASPAVSSETPAKCPAKKELFYYVYGMSPKEESSSSSFFLQTP